MSEAKCGATNETVEPSPGGDGFRSNVGLAGSVSEPQPDERPGSQLTVSGDSAGAESQQECASCIHYYAASQVTCWTCARSFADNYQRTPSLAVPANAAPQTGAERA